MLAQSIIFLVVVKQRMQVLSPLNAYVPVNMILDISLALAVIVCGAYATSGPGLGSDNDATDLADYISRRKHRKRNDVIWIVTMMALYAAILFARHDYNTWTAMRRHNANMAQWYAERVAYDTCMSTSAGPTCTGDDDPTRMTWIRACHQCGRTWHSLDMNPNVIVPPMIINGTRFFRENSGIKTLAE